MWERTERFKVCVASLAKLSFNLDPHLFPSMEKEPDLDAMFTSLVDFAEESAGFNILYTSQSITCM